MAQPSSTTTSSASACPHPENEADSADVQRQAAETINESPSAAIPIPRDLDLEQGDDMAATLVNDEDQGSPASITWRGVPASMSLSVFSGQAAWRQASEDRNR